MPSRLKWQSLLLTTKLLNALQMLVYCSYVFIAPMLMDPLPVTAEAAGRGATGPGGVSLPAQGEGLLRPLLQG